MREDWNLAEQEPYDDIPEIKKTFKIEDIKKCRDLILEDIRDSINNWNDDNGDGKLNTSVDFDKDTIEEIINKRFGDLK